MTDTPPAPGSRRRRARRAVGLAMTLASAGAVLILYGWVPALIAGPGDVPEAERPSGPAAMFALGLLMGAAAAFPLAAAAVTDRWIWPAQVLATVCLLAAGLAGLTFVGLTLAAVRGQPVPAVMFPVLGGVAVYHAAAWWLLDADRDLARPSAG